LPCFAVAPQGASKTAVKNLINVAMFNCHINITGHWIVDRTAELLAGKKGKE
jgi:hypothetical protein